MFRPDTFTTVQPMASNKYIMIPFAKYQRLINNTETPSTTSSCVLEDNGSASGCRNEGYISHTDDDDNDKGTLSVAANNLEQSTSHIAHTLPQRQDIIALLPTKIRHKSNVILTFLERDPLVSWNDKLELVVNNVTIERTNLIDLLKSVQHQYKNLTPRGKLSFVHLLEKYNVPKSCVSVHSADYFAVPTAVNSKKQKRQNNSCKNNKQ